MPLWTPKENGSAPPQTAFINLTSDLPRLEGAFSSPPSAWHCVHRSPLTALATMEIGNGANKAPLLEKGSSSERWHKLKLRFSVLKALDTKNFMEMQAKIFTAGDVADDYPFASRLMTRVNTMASIIAPEEIEPVEDKDNALQTNEEAIVNLLNNCLGSVRAATLRLPALARAWRAVRSSDLTARRTRRVAARGRAC
jgi:hypothetical protein